eukprot:scaffold2499_cov125-Cylindrotheca_fusiformis.AAC.20
MRLVCRLGCLLLFLLWNVFSTQVKKQLKYSADVTSTEGRTFELSYTTAGGSKGKVECPRYFLTLTSEVMEAEILFRHKHGRWSDRVLLEILYFSLDDDGSSRGKMDIRSAKNRVPKWNLQLRTSDHCTWEGISCNQGRQITQIQLDGLDFPGTLPDELSTLNSLEVLEMKREYPHRHEAKYCVQLDESDTASNLAGNKIHGTLPRSYGALTNLKIVNFDRNNFEGTIPEEFARWSNIESLWLSNNDLTGTIPEHLMDKWQYLTYIDLARNNLEGRIPKGLVKNKERLLNLMLGHNKLTGTLPELRAPMNLLSYLDASFNQLTGTIPTTWRYSPNLEGSLPRGDDVVEGLDAPPTGDGKWGNLKKLQFLSLRENQFTGILPPQFAYGLGDSMESLDIGFNKFSGTLPSAIGKLKKLVHFYAPYNDFDGTFPVETKYMNVNLLLNFTENRLHGSIPRLFCASGPKQRESQRYRISGCDMVLCPGGTFHRDGAAGTDGSCRVCPGLKGQDAKILGRTTCPGLEYVHGDLDGDGELSEREILRLLYVYTSGQHWGNQFTEWADPSNHACQLNGVTCVNNHVAKIDLSDAAMCSNGERKPGPIDQCRGLPSELALLPNLEVLTLSRRQFLRGSIPTEFGQLSKLKYFDVSNCPHMRGTLPTELGLLSNLKVLNVGSCRFNGTIPEVLFDMAKLEKLHLSMNLFSGHVPSNVQNLKSIKEIMISRTFLKGSIPNELGTLSSIENLEMYGNQLTGTIPSSLGSCTKLKRIDLFNNKLNGTIPSALSRLQSLQILHVKQNRLTGTIASNFGSLPYLSWFDVSSNRLIGSIPETFGSSNSIKDFRLGGNMIYEPIPPALCRNKNINGGLTTTYGCDGVICSLGTYSDPGHATHSEGCKPCPEGQTTMYLGASSCETFSEKDILSMFFDVMRADEWDPLEPESWKAGSENVCDWEGIDCDEDGEIMSIQFPTSSAAI